jgi:hypothetical protein
MAMELVQVQERVTPEEWQAWAQNRVTKAFVQQALVPKVKEAQDTWAKKGYVGSTAEEANYMNCFALGSVDMLTQLIELFAEAAEGTWIP